jgi:hypothetical protein
MKNQYVGDSSDYRKYGLLRCIAASGLKVGVCWMLTPDGTNQDGRRISYLSHPRKWRPYDPELFDVLADAVGNKKRSVAHLESANVIPGATYSTRILGDPAPQRVQYVANALRELASVDVVFFDPDNGIEVPSVPAGKRGSSRYLYWSEVEAVWNAGKSLLIFQHFRREPREFLVEGLCAVLAARTSAALIASFWTPHVVFLAAVQRRHLLPFMAATQLVAKRWRNEVAVRIRTESTQG